MNPHLERRLETLAREIAARKAPKIDQAANELFALAASKHEQKAPSDWVPKRWHEMSYAELTAGLADVSKAVTGAGLIDYKTGRRDGQNPNVGSLNQDRVKP